MWLRKCSYITASFIVVLASLLASCAPIINDVRYHPSIVMSGKGSVSVREVKYAPAHSVEPNEIYYNSGMGSLYTKDTIKHTYTEAIKAELKFIGYTLNDQSDTSIIAEILDLKSNSIGFDRADYSTKIKFTLLKTNAVTQEEIYSKVYENASTVSKFGEGGAMAQFYIGLAECIKNFLKDLQERKLL